MGNEPTNHGNSTNKYLAAVSFYNKQSKPHFRFWNRMYLMSMDQHVTPVKDGKHVGLDLPVAQYHRIPSFMASVLGFTTWTADDFGLHGGPTQPGGIDRAWLKLHKASLSMQQLASLPKESVKALPAAMKLGEACSSQKWGRSPLTWGLNNQIRLKPRAGAIAHLHLPKSENLPTAQSPQAPKGGPFVTSQEL